MDFSPAQEAIVGESIMGRIRNTPNYVEDPEVSYYLNQLGYRLVAQTKKPSMFFNFFVMSDKRINAFALPGGYIGIHTGLMLASENESMLAGVIGHEIAHVTQRHIARIISSQKRAQLGSLAAVAAAILASRAGSQISQAALMTSTALPIQSRLNFTRAYEREADRIGLDLLKKSGFDVHQVPVFFDRMRRQSRLYDSGIPEFLRTHPMTFERIADVEARTRDLPTTQVEDGIDLSLVKARLRVMSGSPSELQALFEDQIDAADPRERIVGVYGTVLLAIRSPELTAEKLIELRALMNAVFKSEPEHPMLFSVQADLERVHGSKDLAEELYNAGLSRYPGRVSLLYGYSELLLKAQRYEDLIDLMTRSFQESRRYEAKFYDYRSKAYEGLKRSTAMYRDQAEALALKGNLGGAINALKSARSAKDGDFYLMMAVDARLRELQKLQASMR